MNSRRNFHIAQILSAVTRPLDIPMLVIFGLLMTYAVIIMASASPDPRYITSQLLHITLALTCMWVLASIPTQRLLSLAPLLYIVGVLLLVAVSQFGVISKGARRWLDIGGLTRIQPSEIMKIAMPLALAWLFQKREGGVSWWAFLVAAVMLAVPVALIAKQPDLGTAVLVSAAGLFVIFFAGLSWKLVIPVLLAGMVSVTAFGIRGDQWCQMEDWPVLHGYQKDRICMLLNPGTDKKGKGYHINQSTITIGSGGVYGKGWKQGTQTQLDFLPERHTDFVFAVLAEEFGLMGGLVLLVLYLALLIRGFMIAASAPTLGARLLGASTTMTFFTYIFVNIGMVSGILPVVGVPLPFISYGGTALVTLCLGIGILMGVRGHSIPDR